MTEVNVAEVKARLSDYLDRCARGERIVVCRNNRPVAELRPIEAARTDNRPIGPLPGRPTFEVPPAFFEPLPATEFAEWDGASPNDPLTAAPPPASPRASRVAEARPTRTARGRSSRRRS